MQGRSHGDQRGVFNLMIPATASRPLRRETPFEQVAARLPHWMRPHLPRKWVQLGRVLLLRLPHVLEDERQPVAAAYATLPGVEAVMRRPRIGGELRQPLLPQLLLGSSAETEVREHGLCYRLDLQRVMSNSFGFGGTNASLVFQKFAG